MSNVRMFTMQEMRETYKKRCVQRMRQEVVGVYLQVKSALPDIKDTVEAFLPIKGGRDEGQYCILQHVRSYISNG